MAANLDRAESSLTAVSDVAYLRGVDSSGNSVRISKADLASVLGVMQNKNIPQEKDLNDIKNVGFYLIQVIDGAYTNKPVGARDYGVLVVFAAGNYIIQVWIEDGIYSKMYIRGNWYGGPWYGWREIALTAQ